MAITGGNKTLIKVSLTPIATKDDGVILGNTDTANYGTSKETFTITGFGDNYERNMVGLRSLSGSFGGVFNPTDEGQVMLMDNDYIYVAFFWQGIDGYADVVQLAVTEFSIDADVAGRQSYSASLAGFGEAPTKIGVV